MAYQFRREPLTAENADRLVNACTAFQEKLVIWTLIDTGLRVGEFCALRPQRVEWQYERVVVHGKGGPYGSLSRRRVVPLTPRVSTTTLLLGPLTSGQFAQLEAAGLQSSYRSLAVTAAGGRVSLLR